MEQRSFLNSNVQITGYLFAVKCRRQVHLNQIVLIQIFTINLAHH
jgi:hypothetical protein